MAQPKKRAPKKRARKQEPRRADFIRAQLTTEEGTIAFAGTTRIVAQHINTFMAAKLIEQLMESENENQEVDGDDGSDELLNFGGPVSSRVN